MHREGEHLTYSRQRVYGRVIDADWVEQLSQQPETAEGLEAFVFRFGRMQDTIAEEPLPCWLQALAETPGSLIETLNQAERLGVVESVDDWLAARKLRNRLIHVYAEDANDFADALSLAEGFSLMLPRTYNRIRDFALHRMGIEGGALPPALQNDRGSQSHP